MPGIVDCGLPIAPPIINRQSTIFLAVVESDAGPKLMVEQVARTLRCVEVLVLQR